MNSGILLLFFTEEYAQSEPTARDPKTQARAKSNKMRYLLFYCFFPTLLSAQSHFIKDPAIVWAKEIEMDWVVDVSGLEREGEYGIIAHKQMSSHRHGHRQKSPTLANLVFQDAIAGKCPVFSDPECLHPVDTAVFHKFKCEDVKAWRIREILCYSPKKSSWTAYVESIAPVAVSRNTVGDSVDLKPVFWFRAAKKPVKSSSRHVAWAKTIQSVQQSTFFNIEEEGKPVKIINGFRYPLEHQLKVWRSDMRVPFFDASNEKIQTPADRLQMDTVVTFDPVTYDEYVTVCHSDIDPSRVKHIRLVHQWCWNAQRSQLSVTLKAVAPMINGWPIQEEFRYYQPLYYSRTGF